VTATEGQSFSGSVASFTNVGYPSNSASDFSASIDWGDGQTSTGSVSSDGQGNLTVSGSHTYADEGSFSVAVTLVDNDDDGSGQANASATAYNTVFVAEADNLSAATIQPTASVAEGDTSASIAIATFTNTGYPGADPSDFQASINWGDGQSSTGSVSSDGNGNLTVWGSHSYADEGSFEVSVTLTDTDDDGSGQASASATAFNSITVTEADVLSAGPVSASATEGQTFSGAVATFTNTGYPSNDASDFSASINWGDGQTTSGSVSSDGNGHLTVFGSHMYADEGSYGVVVKLTDTDDDASGLASASATAIGAISVAEGDVLSGQGRSLGTTEGQTFSGSVAVFTNSGYPGNSPNDFTASIDWGDGTTTSGSITSDGQGVYTVSGTHSYAEDGSYSVTVTLADDDPPGPVSLASSTAHSDMTVAEVDLTATGVGTLTATEGQSFAGTVATFSDPGSPDSSDAYSAIILWGDGTSSQGSISGSNGNFTISGSHTYADEGHFAVTTLIVEGSTSLLGEISAEYDTDNTVFHFRNSTGQDFTDASITGNAISGSLQGQSATWSLGTIGAGSSLDLPFDGSAGNIFAEDFDDSFSGEVVYTFNATWNGRQISVTFSPSNNASGSFVAFLGNGPDGNELDDNVSDTTVGLLRTSDAVATGTAVVAEADALTAVSGPSLASTEGQTFGGVVATFANTGYPGANPGDFAATIDWGDGSTSSGSVSSDGNGNFTVFGFHSYADEGNYAVAVTLKDTDDDGSGEATASATARGSIVVAEADAFTAIPVSFSASEGQTFRG
jgi:hypothetical protein